MGIPKFYRWLSERYPLLNQKLTLTEGPPEIDNLYLDMNGIIHNCTHANRKDIGGVTEEDMMMKVFAYLEKLIQIVRPQKLLFMAIDGVAPRAKMNQQRSRRFKSAMERLKNEEEQRRKGEVVPEDAFDSNCITPGTPFMARLGQHLRFFIRRKMAEDPLWQKPTVVFSGHEVPGEGEHKIMEYIRWEKRQASYQPNQRHCMYGLDADLIMLSLVTHEPHFCLLREVVSYTGSNRGQPAREVLDNPCAENFILFQIGLLREYFELEYGNLRLPFPLDLERIVDDYVLMCMLVGNDFLPALPTLDIAEGALNKLMELYKELLPKLGGYLTHAGELDRQRLQMLLERIGQLELETLEERAQDAEYMESKRAKRAARNGMGSRNQLDEVDQGLRSLAVSQPDVRKSILDGPLEPEGAGAGPPVVQQGPTMMSREARQMMMAGLGQEGLQLWKDRYYNEKLHAYSPEDRRQVVEHYVAGLHWVLEYYYRGVASWDWYYPYHYAPMASDMKDLDSIQVAFAQGTPFRPFEQLLAVLPAASCKLLPPAFHTLMTDPESPVIDFYPATFQVDMEGKRADWEGVVLVPFVDEVRLLQAVRSIRTSLLAPEELARNQLGQIQIYQYHRNLSEPKYCSSTMPKHFSDIKVCHSRCSERPPPPPLPPGGKGFTPVLVAGTRVGLQAPSGMPTLKSLQVRPALRNVGINVLGTPSRKESIVLTLKDLREALGGAVLSAEQVAASGLLGSRAYINWPYLQEARVVRVSDCTSQASFDKNGAIKVQKWTQGEAQRWDTDAHQLAGTFLTRCGIDVGKVDLVVGVKVCLGYIRHADSTIEKTYSKDEVQVPLQAVIRQRPQQAAGGAATAADDTPGFPELHEGMQVVYLGKHHFGCMATVLPDLERGLAKQQPKQPKRGAAAPNGHYRLLVQPVSDEVGTQALRQAKRVVERFAVKYYNSGEVSNRVGISPRLLGRVTGNLWVRDGDDRYDLGLAIKTSARDVCVPGFSQPTEDGNGWTYSAAVITILQEYRKQFPWLWAQLIKSEGEGAGDVRVDQLLPGLSFDQRKERLRDVTNWIKSTPLAKRPLVKLGVKLLSDEGVKALDMTAPTPGRAPPAVEYENVPPVLLLLPYTPGPDQVKLSVQGGPFELGDRVVCVSGKGTPPYGLRGTVIGVYDEACEVVFDQDFSGGSDLGGRAYGKRGAYVPRDLLMSVNRPVEISLARHQVPRQQGVKQQQQPQGQGQQQQQQPQPGAVNGAKPQKPQQQQSGTADGTKPGPDAAAVKAARKAMQQLSVAAAAAASTSGSRAAAVATASATTPCVPGSVAVAAPVSPPVPSTKLLGAAMRAAVSQPAAPQPQRQQQQPQQQAPGPGSAPVGAGTALLQKLKAGAAAAATVGQPGSGDAQQDKVVVAAAAAAAAALVSPGGSSTTATTSTTTTSLDQLKKLVPNMRVETSSSSSIPQHRASQGVLQQPDGGPRGGSAPPQSPAHPPPPPPPPVAPQYPPQGPMMMMPPPPPHMVEMQPPRAPYMAGPFHPQHGPPGHPPMFFPPYPPPMPMGPGAGMPMMMPPPPPGAGPMMGPGGMAGPFLPPPFGAAPPPMLPPPGQPPFNGGHPMMAPRAPPPPPPPQPATQNGSSGGALAPPLPPSPPAIPQGTPAGPPAQPPPPAMATAATAPRPVAPSSHPIDVTDCQQGADEPAEQGMAGPAAAPAPAAVPQPNGSQAGSRSGSGGGAGATAGPAAGRSDAAGVRPGPAASVHGKSARLPDAAGKGFKGRGKPAAAPAAPAPPAPGSLAAAAVTPGRFSLDVANPGQALLRSLQAAGSAATVPSNGAVSAGGSPVTAPSAPPAAASEAGAGGTAAAAAPPANAGAALLRQLQQRGATSTGDVDAALKAQSLDSGTELLRALQRAQQQPQQQPAEQS